MEIEFCSHRSSDAQLEIISLMASARQTEMEAVVELFLIVRSLDSSPTTLTAAPISTAMGCYEHNVLFVPQEPTLTKSLTDVSEALADKAFKFVRVEISNENRVNKSFWSQKKLPKLFGVKLIVQYEFRLANC